MPQAIRVKAPTTKRKKRRGNVTAAEDVAILRAVLEVRPYRAVHGQVSKRWQDVANRAVAAVGTELSVQICRRHFKRLFRLFRSGRSSRLTAAQCSVLSALVQDLTSRPKRKKKEGKMTISSNKETRTVVPPETQQRPRTPSRQTTISSATLELAAVRPPLWILKDETTRSSHRQPADRSSTGTISSPVHDGPSLFMILKKRYANAATSAMTASVAKALRSAMEVSAASQRSDKPSPNDSQSSTDSPTAQDGPMAASRTTPTVSALTSVERDRLGREAVALVKATMRADIESAVRAQTDDLVQKCARLEAACEKYEQDAKQQRDKIEALERTRLDERVELLDVVLEAARIKANSVIIEQVSRLEVTSSQMRTQLEALTRDTKELDGHSTRVQELEREIRQARADTQEELEHVTSAFRVVRNYYAGIESQLFEFDTRHSEAQERTEHQVELLAEQVHGVERDAAYLEHQVSRLIGANRQLQQQLEARKSLNPHGTKDLSALVDAVDKLQREHAIQGKKLLLLREAQDNLRNYVNLEVADVRLVVAGSQTPQHGQTHPAKA